MLLLLTPQITKLETLEGRAIIGTASGSVHLVDMSSGRSVSTSVSSDHMDAVTGIGPSVYLQHFVSCGKDSFIKVRHLLCISMHPLQSHIRTCICTCICI